MGAELISLIMPVYNRERYVREALESLISQTYSPLELIVVNDGSTDGTGRVLEELRPECEKRFARVEFLSQENQGTATTLNRLFEAAQGRYVYRLDSDDLARPEAVETLQAFLRNHPDYGLAVGDDELINAEGRRVFWTKDRRFVEDPAQARYLTFAQWLKDLRPEIDFSSDDFGGYESLLNGNYIPGGYLVRRELMQGIRFSSEAPLEDHFMMLRLARITKMKYIDQVLYSYRWHGQNSIVNRKKSRSFSRRTLKYELEDLLKSNDPKLAALAEERLSRVKKKSKLKLGRLMELYKLSYVDRIEYRLRLGSGDFLLKAER